jgi:hypothetical protein
MTEGHDRLGYRFLKKNQYICASKSKMIVIEIFKLL